MGKNGIYKRRVRHGDSDVHDLCLLTRKTSAISLNELPNLWGGASDAKEKLALFLLYNKASFSFLGIDVSLAEDGSSALIFKASEKVGCAPLFSPVSARICASIIVKGNMNEDISEVLPLIEGNLNIEFSDKLILPYKTAVKPPVYFECAKYIDQYIKAKRIHWKKFISEERTEPLPASSTQWAKYSSRSYNPLDTMKYPNKKNLLSEDHREWREINFVLKYCLDEISSPLIPCVSRRAYRDKVEDLRRKINFRYISKPTELRIHSADPQEIKTLKTIGNRILNSITTDYRAWRVDFSKLFENYVQYIFTQVANNIGANTVSNGKFSVIGASRNWTLTYLEPDIVIRKGNDILVADAKYKMHMFNSMSENVDSLKESFRHDLHQVLAYSSFEKDVNKTAMIVYPYNSFVCMQQLIKNPFVSVTNKVLLFGIPWGVCSKNDSEHTLSINEKVRIAVNGIVGILNRK